MVGNVLFYPEKVNNTEVSNANGRLSEKFTIIFCCVDDYQYNWKREAKKIQFVIYSCPSLC